MNQIRIDTEGNSATIDLNSFFYPLNLVQWASAEFKEIASTSIKKDGSRTQILLTPLGKEEVEETALAFCNFVLSLRREFGQHA